MVPKKEITSPPGIEPQPSNLHAITFGSLYWLSTSNYISFYLEYLYKTTLLVNRIFQYFCS
jgi:hypothetical protein